MRGTWHFGAQRLHVMGTCRWCPSRADQATQERSESMLKDPRRLPFLSWARFPRLMWHWTALAIDPVTSRSPCLSHFPVSEPGGEFSRLSLPWTSHGLGCDRPENFCQKRGEICGGGSVANFLGAQLCAKQARKFRRKISPQISPLEKQSFATFLPWPKSKFRRFRLKFRHVQNQYFHCPVCQVSVLSQPHWLALSYISKPSLGRYLLFRLCERSWKRA